MAFLKKKLEKLEQSLEAIRFGRWRGLFSPAENLRLNSVALCLVKRNPTTLYNVLWNLQKITEALSGLACNFAPYPWGRLEYTDLLRARMTLAESSTPASRFSAKSAWRAPDREVV